MICTNFYEMLGFERKLQPKRVAVLEGTAYISRYDLATVGMSLLRKYVTVEMGFEAYFSQILLSVSLHFLLPAY